MPPSLQQTTSSTTIRSSSDSDDAHSGAADQYVPVLTSLSSVYSSSALPAQELRWKALSAAFAAAFPGEKLSFIARSPGRVNIIGEHIDYSLFDVLPMAITQDVLIAVHVGADDGKIILQNTDKHFPTREYNTADLQSIIIDATVHEWSNYFLAGVKGAFAVTDSIKIPSMHVVIDGRIPTGSGLSSSSAFVCAALLSVLASVQYASSSTLNNVVTKTEMVGSAVIAERNVGVNSGGMDQSASVFGVPGHSLRVQFYPTLKATPIAFQGEGFAFVIANTLVVADKFVTGPIHYNLRVVETTVAAEILARVCELGPLPIRDGFGGTLRGVVEAFKAKGVSIDGVIEEVKKVFSKEEGYTLAETAQFMAQSEKEVVRTYMTRFPIRAERFQFRKRALHVLLEAQRVEKFCELLGHAPEDGAEKKYLSALGEIMNASHKSCKELFECSCEELDEVVKLALANGAYGSRLTGAGWGGATVSLVPKSTVGKFVEQLKQGYYLKRFPEITKGQLEDAICVTEPGLGSALVEYA